MQEYFYVSPEVTECIFCLLKKHTATKPYQLALIVSWREKKSLWHQDLNRIQPCTCCWNPSSDLNLLPKIGATLMCFCKKFVMSFRLRNQHTTRIRVRFFPWLSCNSFTGEIALFPAEKKWFKLQVESNRYAVRYLPTFLNRPSNGIQGHASNT